MNNNSIFIKSESIDIDKNNDNNKSGTSSNKSTLVNANVSMNDIAQLVVKINTITDSIQFTTEIKKVKIMKSLDFSNADTLYEYLTIAVDEWSAVTIKYNKYKNRYIVEKEVTNKLREQIKNANDEIKKLKQI